MRAAILSLLILITSAVSTLARTWGFDKDTVYEWRTGKDTAFIVNSGSTTVQFDSIIVENLNKEWGNLLFEQPLSSAPIIHNFYEGVLQSKKITLITESGQKTFFNNFNLATFAPTAKASQTNTAFGDTTQVRLRLVSTSSEEDTLVIKGVYDYLSAIRNKPRSIGTPLYQGGASYDVLGRNQSTHKPELTTLSTQRISR